VIVASGGSPSAQRAVHHWLGLNSRVVPECSLDTLYEGAAFIDGRVPVKRRSKASVWSAVVDVDQLLCRSSQYPTTGKVLCKRLLGRCAR
jgi:hypothetical protein